MRAKNNIQGYVIEGRLDSYLNPITDWQKPQWEHDRDNYIYQLQQEGYSYEHAEKFWVDTVTHVKKVQSYKQ